MEFRSGHFVSWCATLCFILLAPIQVVQGTGHIEVHFLEYTANCEEDHFFYKSACDPKFSFCLNSVPQYNGKPVNNCNYATTGLTPDHFHDTNHIILETMTSILGISNPWIIQVEKFLSSAVLLAVVIRDVDVFVDDHLETLSKAMAQTIWPSREVSGWMESEMGHNGYKIRFRIRLYCDANYYTTSCDKYCKIDNATHGYCHPQTGEVICHPGWTGDDCNTDIDECELGFCVVGNCTNLPGDYNCDCPPYATGKNCTDACRNDPCQNGGTCFAHITEDEYLCKCTEGWEGMNCDKEKVPCNPNDIAK